MTSDNGSIDEAVLRDVLLAVKSIRFGCVQLVIHDAKIVQIEKTEKIRFGLDRPERA